MLCPPWVTPGFGVFACTHYPKVGVWGVQGLPAPPSRRGYESPSPFRIPFMPPSRVGTEDSPKPGGDTGRVQPLQPHPYRASAPLGGWGGAGRPPPAPAPGTRLSGAAVPDTSACTDWAPPGAPRERRRVPASVSPGCHCWVSHCGAICTVMGGPVPLPAPPNPARGYHGAAEGVGVSRFHFSSRGRDRDWGHLLPPSRGPNPCGNSSWGFGAPAAPQGRHPSGLLQLP